jgi:hypothetical protein
LGVHDAAVHTATVAVHAWLKERLMLVLNFRYRIGPKKRSAPL